MASPDLPMAFPSFVLFPFHLPGMVATQYMDRPFFENPQGRLHMWWFINLKRADMLKTGRTLCRVLSWIAVSIIWSTVRMQALWPLNPHFQVTTTPCLHVNVFEQFAHCLHIQSLQSRENCLMKYCGFPVRKRMAKHWTGHATPIWSVWTKKTKHTDYVGSLWVVTTKSLSMVKDNAYWLSPSCCQFSWRHNLSSKMRWFWWWTVSKCVHPMLMNMAEIQPVIRFFWTFGTIRKCWGFFPMHFQAGSSWYLSAKDQIRTWFDLISLLFQI